MSRLHPLTCGRTSYKPYNFSCGLPLTHILTAFQSPSAILNVQYRTVLCKRGKSLGTGLHACSDQVTAQFHEPLFNEHIGCVHGDQDCYPHTFSLLPLLNGVRDHMTPSVKVWPVWGDTQPTTHPHSDHSIPHSTSCLVNSGHG